MGTKKKFSDKRKKEIIKSLIVLALGGNGDGFNETPLDVDGTVWDYCSICGGDPVYDGGHKGGCKLMKTIDDAKLLLEQM